MAAKLKGLMPKLSQRQTIAIAKGVLAYTLAFVFIFLRGFNKLNSYPITLTSVILVAIAGKPGVSIGACLDGSVLGMAGVGIGSACFAILAKLGHSHVAQGFVFFIMLYFLALIKAQSMRYFAFSLLAIILAFNGIYTSVLLKGVFSPKYLEAYLEAYLWGFAIVLAVNIFVFPVTSERELREFLVVSLEHISTFSHLIAKTYLIDLTDEERVVRDQLNQSIRSDMALLMQKLAETGLEVNYTKWSLTDYATIMSKIRQMQQGLITSYSSLIAMENHDRAALNLIKSDLLDCGTDRAFAKLRRGIDLAMADIVSELAVGKRVYHSPAPGSYSWDDFIDIDQAPSVSTTSTLHGDKSDAEEKLESFPQKTKSTPGVNTRPRGLSRGLSQSVIENRLGQVSENLKAEVANVTGTPVGSRRNSFSEAEEIKGEASPSSLAAGHRQTLPVPTGSGSPGESGILDRVAFLRGSWASFERAQNASITRLLATGIAGDRELLAHQAGPSLHEQFSNPEPGHRMWTSGLKDKNIGGIRSRVPARKAGTETEQASGEAQLDEATELSSAMDSQDFSDITGSTIMRVQSFLFGMGKVLEEIAATHQFVVPSPDAPEQHRKKAIHFHWFESIPSAPKPPPGSMSFKAAYREVTGKELATPKKTIWTRLAALESLLRSDTSLYAFKTTFFVDYGLTGGIITIVVAMAPTLGQTFFTFVIQIMGTGVGSIYAMIILYIFRDVGGFHFNPYGLVCMSALFAIPMSYIIYVKPMFFAGGLLALNGSGILLVTEWVYREIPGFIRPGFDNPAHRAAKALVAMSLALGIAGTFQIFLLRTPARQTLRVKLAELTFGLAGYNVLLSAMSEALVPTVAREGAPVSLAALKAVHAELIARETALQIQLLSLMPLLKFGAAEPSFGKPFQVGTIARIIRLEQIVLDRLREARTAIGAEGFGPEIKEHFIQHLAPYRRQSRRFSRALFYLCATSLATKTPLPHELPSMSGTARMIQHDAMVLSHRLTKSEEGLAVLRSPGFLRYWFFLVSYSSVSFMLEAIETDLRILFGDVDVMSLHRS